MIALFLWFFSIDTLNTICQHTNAKAMEKVWKTRHTHPDGRVYYKVCCMHMHAYIHISMRMHGRTCIQSHTYMHSCYHINAHRPIVNECLAASNNGEPKTGPF